MAVTWLHVSDFHFRTGDAYDRDVVLRALLQSIRHFYDIGRRPDLIFVTGDIAYSGKEAEYALAEKFFDDVLATTGLTRDRLFVVPGNHDVDRDAGEYLQRTLETREAADKYFRLGSTPPHFNKLASYRKWHDAYFSGIRTFPTDTTCAPLTCISVNGQEFEILLTNSALFAQDDADHGKLWLGRRCLDKALSAHAPKNPAIRIALQHHPLDWLHEVEFTNIENTLTAYFDVILRGHLHRTDLRSVATESKSILQFAAGAAYQTRKYPNKAMYCTVESNKVEIFPIRYEDDPKEIWTLDTSVFPETPGYIGHFTLPRQVAPQQTTNTAVSAPLDPLVSTNRLRCQLESLVKQVISNPGLHSHPFLCAWDNLNPEVPLADIVKHCCIESDPNELLWRISEAVQKAALADSSKVSLAGGKVADLIAHMCLIACARWISKSNGETRWVNGLPNVSMFEEIAAAVVAATWLNIGLKLRCSDSAGGRIEIANLISDRAETQFGVKTVEQAIEDEIFTRIIHELAVPGKSTQGQVDPNDVRAGINFLEKRTGARLFVGICTDHRQRQVDEALRKRIKDLWDIEVFIYAGSEDQVPEADRQKWIALQNSLMGHFERILQPVYQPSPNPRPSPHSPGTIAAIPRNKVFISYARADDRFRKYVVEHLSVLESQGLVELWDDQRIAAGANWQQEIDRELKSCKVAVLLVSPAFMKSSFIRENELPVLLSRHEQNGMHLMPILIRPFAWKTVEWLQAMQMRPDNADSLATAQRRRDQQLAMIATEINNFCKNP